MCIFRFVPKFNIFNIYAKFPVFAYKFSIFMQNLQYLYKSSIFMLNLQYLYICVSLYLVLSLVCVQADLSSFRSQREGSGFVLFLCQNLQSCTLYVFTYVLVHILVFYSFLSDPCTSGLMSYFRSQREGISLSLFASFVFLYII